MSPIHNLTPLLHVFDMHRSVRFYCDVLGFTVVSTSSPGNDFYWAMLRLGGATLMLNTAYDDGERPPETDCGGWRRMPIRHCDFGCDNADAVYAHLCDKGWLAQVPVSTHYGMRQVYTKDPDGFELCFQHPVCPPEGSHVGP